MKKKDFSLNNFEKVINKEGEGVGIRSGRRGAKKSKNYEKLYCCGRKS